MFFKRSVLDFLGLHTCVAFFMLFPFHDFLLFILAHHTALFYLIYVMVSNEIKYLFHFFEQQLLFAHGGMMPGMVVLTHLHGVVELHLCVGGIFWSFHTFKPWSGFLYYSWDAQYVHLTLLSHPPSDWTIYGCSADNQKPPQKESRSLLEKTPRQTSPQKKKNLEHRKSTKTKWRGPRDQHKQNRKKLTHTRNRQKSNRQHNKTNPWQSNWRQNC